MDFDNEDGDKRTDTSDYSDGGDHEKPSKKDLLIGRRKDKKESKKDRGYAALEGESSPEEEAETKSPSKSKKTKAFKFPSKSKEKREKSRDKEKINEKEAKEKEKELSEKEKKKEKLKKEKEKREKVKEKEKEEKIKIKESKEKSKEKEKDKSKDKEKDKKERKSSKQQSVISAGIPFEEIFTLGVAQPIFGVPLGLAVERSRCHDDSNLPLVVRHCIDYLQEYGIQSDSIYRVDPPKQRVQILKKWYNDREPVTEKDYEIATACTLLKLFITELPEPILTTELCSQFEEVNTKSPEKIGSLISQLPSSNKSLLGWLILHFVSLLANDKMNKLSIHLLGTLLGQTLNMSMNLISTFVVNYRIFFPDIVISKYIPPLTSAAKLPDTAEEIIKELKKQESLLNQIHAEMHAGFVTQKREEQLWEGQRIVTQLKRKLRSVQKFTDAPSFSQPQSSVEDKQGTIEEDASEKPIHSDAACANSLQISIGDKRQTIKVSATIPTEPKLPFNQEKTSPEMESEVKTSFTAGSFEDNFESFEDVVDANSNNNLNSSKNEMTDSVYSTKSDGLSAKCEKPTLSDEELQLMKLQLEHAEFLHLKSILQAKINSERFEIVKLRSHMAIKNKQENNFPQMNLKDTNNTHIYTDNELEERQRLIKENSILEQKRLSLANQIFQERLACIQLRVQLAMNEIL